jgi:signal transduction histidine kinase
MRRGRRRLRRAVRVAWPLLLTGFLLLAVLPGGSHARSDAVRWGVGVPAVLVQGLALYWRRSRPVLVTAVALVGSLVLMLAAPNLVVPFTGLVAVCSLAALRPPLLSVPALVALLGVTATNLRTGTAGDTYFTMAMDVVAWALGETVRNRRVAIEQESRRAVVEERSRIAREMHDVIAHSVSVIVVQAAAADDVFDVRPDQARQALRSIESTGREALLELRRLLGAVRPGGPTAADDGRRRGRPRLRAAASSRTAVGRGGAEPNREAHDVAPPQPGLGRVDELAAPLRAGGLDVRVSRAGLIRPLAAGVDVSAYRIVQEALTNALRHAHAGRVDVTITYAADTIEIEIVDDGRSAALGRRGAGTGEVAGTGGHGIVGMRERAGMLGGALTAGPDRDGGFRVHARLPAPALPKPAEPWATSAEPVAG